MRLLTRKIHRAFPELDTYDDEQCARFIKSARSNPWVMLVHAAAVLGTMLPLLLLGLWGAVRLMDRWKLFEFGVLDDLFTKRMLYWLSTGGVLLLVGPVAGYIVRDLLLRQRLRYVLRVRGGCPGCGYSVIGLAVTLNDNGTAAVRCPECGVEAEVDPSLAELVKDGGPTLGGPQLRGGSEFGGSHLRGESSGGSSLREESSSGPTLRGGSGALATGRVFVGGQRVDLSVFWTAKRRRKAKRAVLFTAAFLFGTALLIVATNEIFIRWQAGRAKQVLAQAQADFLALAQKGYEAAEKGQLVGLNGTVTASSVWDHTNDILRRIERADGPVWRTEYMAGTGTSTIYPDFGSINNPKPNQYDGIASDDLANYLKSIDLARSLIDLYETAPTAESDEAPGVWGSLPLLINNRNVRLPNSALTIDPASPNEVAIIGRTRELCRILAGRTAIAVQRGDRATFMQSLEAIMALARATRAQPVLGALFSSIGYESFCLEHLRVMLMRGQIKPDWVPEIQDILARQRVPLNFDTVVESQRLQATAAIATYFIDPASARFGRLSAPFRRLSGMDDWLESWWKGASGGNTYPLKVRLGTLRENLSVADAVFAFTAPLANAEFYQLATITTPPPSQAMFTLALVAENTSPNTSTYSTDMLAANQRGIDTWLALERFKADTGNYPASLAELVPKYLPAKPTDPWTGRAILYRQTPPGTDPDNRPFVLYFTGRDTLDDGGQGVVPGQNNWVNSKDLVVNDPRR